MAKKKQTYDLDIYSFSIAHTIHFIELVACELQKYKISLCMRVGAYGFAYGLVFIIKMFATNMLRFIT